ncbi:MAG: glycine cleavage T C-terminal barrel domain-containing protein, partial [Actinomycetota bacterium]
PLLRDGLAVGYVTGGAWGHSVEAAVGMAIAIRGDQKVDKAWIDDGEWAVELPGGPIEADVQLRPWLR